MISEYKFWGIRQQLEETIQGILADPEANFDTILSRKEFQGFIYKELGVVGGAYVLADLSRNELFYLQNRNLQRKLLQVNANLPFIGIPHKYAQEDEDGNEVYKISEEYNDLIDALLIGTQDRQTIYNSSHPSPDFYKFLPHLLEDKQFKKLLPFEQKIAKDKFKIIYCTAGEVLFHLYIWRFLFRLAQTEGLEKGLIKKEGYEKQFKLNYPFWTYMSQLVKERTPEADWQNALKNRYANNKAIQERWEALTREIDVSPILDEESYSFHQEYYLLGLIDQDGNAKRPLLALIRYAIHIAQTHLKWTAYDDNSDTIPYAGLPRNEETLDPKIILTSLYVLERRLNRYFHEDKEQSQAPPIDLDQLKNKYQLDACLRKIAKGYMFKEILKVESSSHKLSNAIKELHKETRFPILPYFYELVSGDKHTPKEHIVLNIWNSPENKIILNLSPAEGKTVKEPAVAFLTLTVRPIWDLEHDVYFTRNNESIHWSSRLSEAAYTRLFRILSFFSVLSRPLIDRVFYGEMIKKEIERNASSTDINALSHELSKVVDNIFELSNVSFLQLFGGNEEIQNTVATFLANMSRESNKGVNIDPEKKFNFSAKEVLNWRIIPNFKRFTIWNKYLNMWAGRRGKFILNVKEESSLEDIIKESHLLAARMFIGAEMQNMGKSINYQKERYYQLNFERQLSDLLDRKPKIKYEDELIKTYKLLPAQSNGKNGKQGVQQNAFLRTLIASITNIFEHTTSNYYLNIRVKKDPLGNLGLRFCFVNPCKKIEGDPEISQGTRPVINSCLVLVKGAFEVFGRPEIKEQETHWAKKAGINLGEYDIWLTKFIIPMEQIFIYE